MTAARDDYQTAGYNNFFRRNLNSNSSESLLKNIGSSRVYQPQDINFDGRQTTGSLGDVIRVGKAIELNGPAERISIRDREGNEVTRIGDMES